MELVRDDHLVDAPDPKAPCQCDINAAKHDLRVFVDDLLYTHNLEWAATITVSRANSELDDLMDRLIEPVGSCAECAPEPDRNEP